MLIFYCISLYATWFFAPWDTAFILPDASTWEYQVNAFIDETGYLLFAIVPIGLSVYLAFRQRFSLSYNKLIANNFTFLLGLFLAAILSAFINQSLFPTPQLHYGLSIVPLIAFIIVIGWCLSHQVYLGQKQEKKKRESSQYEHKRLEDASETDALSWQELGEKDYASL